MSLGRPVDEPPSDGITAVRFADHSTLLASSWDGVRSRMRVPVLNILMVWRLVDALLDLTFFCKAFSFIFFFWYVQRVYIYDGQSGTKRSELHHGAPVLDATFEATTTTTVYSCGLDNKVQQFDVETGRGCGTLGTHDAAVRCVEWVPTLSGCVISAGWDKTMRLWDPRSNAAVSTSTISDKAYSMSVSPSQVHPLRLVIATKGRHVEVWDVRSLQEPLQIRESPLKYQTRCVRCYPNGEGYALSSIEGRVAMEYFDVAETQRKYAFKCHRRAENGKDVVYPVNAIAFNTLFGTFATGGSDGVVSIWDGQHKKRLTHVTGYPTSVSSLAFNNDSTLMAVASSYCYEQGEVEHPPDALFIRPVTEAELAPRLKQPTH